MVLQQLNHTDVQVPPLVQMAIACVVVLHGRNNKKENPQFSAQVPQGIGSPKKKFNFATAAGYYQWRRALASPESGEGRKFLHGLQVQMS
jgi:hypothetical protein